MLNIRSISKTFGDKKIINSISFSLGFEVVALVGKNGSGKSTLFKMIAGEMTVDEGSVVTDEVIAYLPQQIGFEDLSVFDFLNTDRPNHEVDQALGRLGLISIDKNQKVSDLSGGEKTKLGLTRILLAEPQPTLLLLDEPTNNLDLDGIFWLEEFVSNFDGGVFITSHDRALIDKTADRVIELENGSIKLYGGNYTFYKEQKEIEQLANERRYLIQEKKIESIMDDINMIRSRTLQGEVKFSSRSPYERKKISKAAQQGSARKRKLERFLDSEERVEKPIDKRNYPFHFSGKIHPDKFLFSLKNVKVSFGGRQILDNVSFSITGNPHVWLSGVNGSGKSTIIKLMNRQLNPDAGQVEFGNDIKVGYFSQELSIDDKRSTTMDELTSLGALKTDIYKYSSFLHFDAEDVTKPISSLSRGQLTKVRFIKLLMGNNDLLILDEPTNHLEIDTREQLEEALRYYDGALLIASHDRYFLERVRIDKEFEIVDGNVVER